MVTPVALNGAGCATAVPIVRVEVNNNATKIFVFTAASLLSWIASCLAMRERYLPVGKLPRASPAKNGEGVPSWRFCGLPEFRAGTVGFYRVSPRGAGAFTPK